MQDRRTNKTIQSSDPKKKPSDPSKKSAKRCECLRVTAQSLTDQARTEYSDHANGPDSPTDHCKKPRKDTAWIFTGPGGAVEQRTRAWVLLTSPKTVQKGKEG